MCTSWATRITTSRFWHRPKPLIPQGQSILIRQARPLPNRFNLPILPQMRSLKQKIGRRQQKGWPEAGTLGSRMTGLKGIRVHLTSNGRDLRRMKRGSQQDIGDRSLLMSEVKGPEGRRTTCNCYHRSTSSRTPSHTIQGSLQSTQARMLAPSSHLTCTRPSITPRKRRWGRSPRDPS